MERESADGIQTETIFTSIPNATRARTANLPTTGLWSAQKNFRWFPRATIPKRAKVLQTGSEKAEGTAEKPKLFTLHSRRNGLALMDIGQPSDRLLHDRLIDLVNRMNLANPFEHRQGQAATQMLAEFLKAFEYGIRC
jgi:hypothetical protein